MRSMRGRAAGDGDTLPHPMPMVLAAYLHALDPFVVEFSPGVGVRWYGLSYAVGFALAWLMLRWVARRGWSPLKPTQVGDLVFAVVIGVLAGGRLGYALFYERHLFVQFEPAFPWWGLLAINKGGMSSHGGMIGVIVAVTWFARRRQISALHVLDIGALACTPGLFFGRIANFINAELWGKALPAAQQANPPWWSVKYPQEIIERWLPQGDARLSALEPLRTVVGGKGDDLYFEFTRALHQADQTVISHVKPLLTAYYPSQLLQALTDGPILAIMLCLIWLKPRKPGVVGAWWLIGYGVLRILTEIFREPDQGVALILGLQRGQLLSVLMIVGGAASLAVYIRRDVPRLGGLFARSTTAAQS